jgi:very-short-patch-repair endonuclease
MYESDDYACRQSDDQPFHERAIGLFTFLHALTELRSKTVRTLAQYEKVLWFHEIPREPGCHCIAWGTSPDEDTSEVWLEVKKPRLRPPPRVPEPLEPWLDPKELEDSSQAVPRLRERIALTMPDDGDTEAAEEPQTIFQELADCPEIRSLRDHYVQKAWLPWAGEDRRLQTVQQVYTDLFSIYQKQQRLGEAYEVIMGLGYLTWRTPSGPEIKRHLVTAQTSLTFDATRGVIRLGPAGEGAKPTIEQDMLELQDRPGAEAQQAIEQRVAEIGDALWPSLELQTALTGWVHAASPRGQFDPSLHPQQGSSADPEVHLAPAVILRRRTERSLLRTFHEILTQLRGGSPVPVGVSGLVTILDDADSLRDRDAEQERGGQAFSLPKEIYFPLPANDAQRKIADVLSTRQGVLVQGPPGTGKSHTIVNLVCHLLAIGQRVLVTSHTARALRVLREKFPKEMAELCVSLLGDHLEAMQTLEDSVRGITERYNAWGPEQNQRRIAHLEQQLDEARRAEASTLNQLRAIREAETYRHPRRFGTYEGTAQAIASRLRGEESHYAWLSVQPSEDQEPPLTNTEAMELISLMRLLDSHGEEELKKAIVDLHDLMAPNVFAISGQQEAEAQARFEAAAAQRGHPAYATMASAPREWRQVFLRGLFEFLRAYELVLRHSQPWLQEAAAQILSEQHRRWHELYSLTGENLEALGDRARQATERKISGLGDRDWGTVKRHATALLAHLDTGGGFGFWWFRSQVVTDALYLINEVRVDGRLCSEPQPLRELLEWLDIAEHFNTLHMHWARYSDPPSGPLTVHVAAYRDQYVLLEQALALRTRIEKLRDLMAAIPRLSEPPWHEIEAVRGLHAAAEAGILEEELIEARRLFDTLVARLQTVAIQPNAHPVIRKALQAVRARDAYGYGEAYEILSSLWELRKKLTRRHDLLQRLDAAAPALAATMRATFADEVWEGRMAEFTAAWNWARADGWLRRLSDPEAQQQPLEALQSSRDRILALIRDLAAAKAWGHCFDRGRFSEHVRQHLMAWTMAIRRLGRGTGKYANRHRQAAREHMEQCRSAIPAWIMPLYRVAETIRPGLDTFDVVIIDEASQSGPEALFLLYLAEKVIVVGDDKQISPEFVGITREDVELLRQRYIPDLPHTDALGVEHSFFDQAQIRYGNRIRLREHFRCMPEIIQFSNNLCYRSEPLVPLRQYGAGRLTPVIVTHHVPDGYQEGRSPRVVNQPEAEAIVNQILHCCQHPAYEGKTMGVISLLGEDQARYIEMRLLEKLGPEEVEQRNLVCGDAYAFQGDERDIMFLSLVTAPAEGHRIGTLTSLRDERRFNVAASRARDQMWLFHTATLNDLSPNCLRYRFLQYCQDPRLEPTSLEGLNVEALRAMRATADQSNVQPPDPFESWFEVDVFLQVTARGYRVIPQCEVAGYRIDLVVEGMRGRLAVECDGDAWHGPERYEQDMARQRILERCGWTFWRVRGSSFYRAPERTLEGLWTMLDGLQISATSAGRETGLNASPPGDARSPTAALFKTSTMRDTSASTEVSMEEVLAADTRVVENDWADEAHGIETPPLLPSTQDQEQSGLFGEHTDQVLQHAGSPLNPYQRWTPRSLPDPRTVPMDQIIPGLVEIITVEGPMPCHRAYRLYALAVGIQRVGRSLRSSFNRAVRRAIHLGLIEERNEHASRDQMSQIVRKAGTPAVLLRERGDRALEEIPPAEMGALMNYLLRQEAGLTEAELLRSIMHQYRIGRLTSNIRTMLLEIKERYVEPSNHGRVI